MLVWTAACAHPVHASEARQDASLTRATLAAQATAHEERRHYLVHLDEPALPAYRGGIAGIAPAPRLASGRNKLDTRSAPARAYIDHLKGVQAQRLSLASGALGRALTPTSSFQLAMNGWSVELTGDEAARLAALPGIALVEEVTDVPQNTDVGPGYIGAPGIWDGSAFGGAGSKGEGIVVGILDSGANLDSPSFAELAEDGYAHVNPLGDGQFIGECDPANPGYLPGNVCNNKLIGGYDFIWQYVNPATMTDEPEFDDSSGHGSHTASTVAGNPRTLTGDLDGVKIGGVAPRANLMIFDICYTRISDGLGLCNGAATIEAVEQALTDGLVDVFNYSVGGGASPWTDSVSIAFRNAAAAGMLVAASGGNSGPGAGTLGHNEPWTITSANSSHDRPVAATHSISVAGGPQDVPLMQPNTGAINIPDLSAVPIKVSPSLLACSPLPPGTFAGGFALVARGDCDFSAKINNAQAGGAEYVLIHNNRPGAITNITVAGSSLPTFTLTQADGLAIAAALGSAAGVADFAADLDPPLPTPTQGDVVNNSSSRGPAPFDMLKPDVTAPGTQVLAAVDGPAEAVDYYTGTSMSSPHTAGAAALLYAVRPDWTPMEVKSALMMTARHAGQVKQDGLTPADPFDVGAGYVLVSAAANSGLVMDETIANFVAANPAASVGGDPSTLNLASFQHRDCVIECSFERSFRNPTANSETYAVTFETGSGLAAAFSTTSLSVAAGQSASLSVDFNTLGATMNAWNFGYIILTPSDASLPTLSLPVAIYATQPSPTAVVSAGSEFNVNEGDTTPLAGNFTLSNESIYAALDWSLRTTQYTGALWDQPNADGSTSGIVSTYYNAPNNTGAYTTDDFELAGHSNVTQLYVSGFVGAGSGALGTATAIDWWVFAADESTGLPLGNPETAPGTALFTHTSAPNAPGVVISGGNITLNLATAGRTLPLPAGRYWVTAYPRFNSTASRWNIYTQGVVKGEQAHLFSPVLFGGVPEWEGLSEVLQAAPLDLVFRVTGNHACGAPWLTVAGSGSGTVAINDEVQIDFTVNPSGLAPGVHRGNICIQSNDANRPVIPVPITLTVRGAQIFIDGFEPAPSP
ncbi:MAG: S8 family serine peptidase [Lysobacteraceae bacterium]